MLWSLKSHGSLGEPCSSNCAAFLALKYGILPHKGLDRIAVLYRKACIISHYQVCQNENGFPAALVQPLSSLLKGSCGVGRQTRCDVYQGDRYAFCRVIFWRWVSVSVVTVQRETPKTYDHTIHNKGLIRWSTGAEYHLVSFSSNNFHFSN